MALEYEQGSDDPPVIVAKGQGLLAEKILELAFANGVSVRQDAALADMLSAFELDSEIPEEALMAVAEILAYIYAVNQRMAGDHKPEHEAIF